MAGHSLARHSSGVMVTKLMAARIATDAGCEMSLQAVTNLTRSRPLRTVGHQHGSFRSLKPADPPCRQTPPRTVRGDRASSLEAAAGGTVRITSNGRWPSASQLPRRGRQGFLPHRLIGRTIQVRLTHPVVRRAVAFWVATMEAFGAPPAVVAGRPCKRADVRRDPPTRELNEEVLPGRAALAIGRLDGQDLERSVAVGADRDRHRSLMTMPVSRTFS